MRAENSPVDSIGSVSWTSTDIRTCQQHSDYTRRLTSGETSPTEYIG